MNDSNATTLNAIFQEVQEVQNFGRFEKFGRFYRSGKTLCSVRKVLEVLEVSVVQKDRDLRGPCCQGDLLHNGITSKVSEWDRS